MNPEDVEAAAISACKVAPFWKSAPKSWFTLIESSIYTSRVTKDESKYHLVMSAMPSSDIITETEDERLYNDMSLSNKKPFQLLRHMRSLVDGKISEDALKVKWLALIQVHTRQALKILHSALLSELADELLEIPSTPGVCATDPAVTASINAAALRNKTYPNTLAADISAIRACLVQLTTTQEMLVNRLPLSGDQSNKGKNGNNRRFRLRSTAAKQQIYHFHWKFGAVAHKCQAPCNFKSSNQENK
ncbi:uncharacterized protein LOC116416848 [Nasonia vitripennis]|uniref:DUF7041 domain-containing protein n=1 Tax=Nasonia vitripennis TaxID=7425 RepID=A0A7M7Q6Y6_NASVI|nr:uncharacterized protein LOC116416848 [Nasonia vitripennis]